MRWIMCPNCDGAVRVVDETPCPNCRGCPSCGRKLERGEKSCGCGFASDPERVARLVELFGVAEGQVEITARRFEARKSRERRSLVSTVILVGLLFVAGRVLASYLDPQSFVGYFVFWLALMIILAPGLYVLNRWDRGKEIRMLREERKRVRDDGSVPSKEEVTDGQM